MAGTKRGMGAVVSVKPQEPSTPTFSPPEALESSRIVRLELEGMRREPGLLLGPGPPRFLALRNGLTGTYRRTLMDTVAMLLSEVPSLAL